MRRVLRGCEIALLVLLSSAYMVPLQAQTARVLVLGHVVAPEQGRSVAAQRCRAVAGCFTLKLERGDGPLQEGTIVAVRTTAETTVYDPENFELPVHRVTFAPGLHLKVLLTLDPATPDAMAEAQAVFIGD